MARHIANAFFILVAFGAFAQNQYPFESKKAEKLYNKLEEYYEEYDYSSILKEEENILTFFDPKQDSLTALMYSFLAEAYYYEEYDLQTSIAFYQKEYELRNSLMASGSFDFDMENLVYTYAAISAEAGKYRQAEALYLDLLKMTPEKGKKTEDYVTNVIALADHYTLTGESEKGKKLLKDNRRYINRNSYEEAMSLRFQGDYNEIEGEFSKAEKNYLNALETLEESGYYPSLEYVYIMNALGLLYTNQSRYPVAEEIYLESLSILDRLDADADSYAGVQFNLAQVYYELGRYNEALEIYENVLEADKESFGEESFYVATTSLAIGQIYMELKRYNLALENFTTAKEIFEAIGEENSAEYGRTIAGLLRYHTAVDNYREASEYAELLVTIFKKLRGDDHWEYAQNLSNAAKTYMRLGNLEKAGGYLQNSIEIREKQLGKSHPYYALSTKQLAVYHWKMNNLDEAQEYYQKTFENYFTQINNYFPILSEEEKSKFYYNRLKPAFEQYNSFIVENKSDDKALVGEMYNYQLATKGLILYATNKVRESIINSNDSSLIARYEKWIAQKEQLAQLFSATDIPLEVRNKKIDSLNDISNNLEKELSLASSAFASTFAKQEYTWKDVQKKLKPGEAAVEMIRFRDFSPDSAGVFTDEVYYAALIVRHDTEDYPELVLMRNGKLMETRYLSNYRNAIKYKIDEDYSYRLFWRPIANQLEGIKKVYFSPDGVFNQISIYTLRNPETGNFTLDEIEIQLLTNTKDLVAFASTSTNPGAKSYLFGYPNYNLGKIDDDQNNGENTGTEEAAEDRGMSRGGVRGARGERGDADLASLSRGGSIPRGLRGNLLRYMQSNQLLALLPGTKKEVTLIDSLYQRKNESVVTYLSNNALEDSLKQVQSPKTLHIATHGFFLESTSEENDDFQMDEYVENPLLRSGLILAGANSFIRDGEISDKMDFNDDGILTAYEAMNLDLDNTALVVLSACETGLGEVKNGEGVFGLQRAFQVAGAESIIMSMWSVDDAATQELMTTFYDEWLGGKTKQEAFIVAQKKLKAKWKSPYFWGAFVMIGI